MSEIYEELGLKQADITYKQAMTVISDSKGKTPYIEYLIDISDESKQQEFIDWDSNLPWKIFCKYVIKQKKSFALDFEEYDKR